jgi:hypothetical protein
VIPSGFLGRDTSDSAGLGLASHTLYACPSCRYCLSTRRIDPRACCTRQMDRIAPRIDAERCSPAEHVVMALFYNTLLRVAASRAIGSRWPLQQAGSGPSHRRLDTKDNEHISSFENLLER